MRAGASRDSGALAGRRVVMVTNVYSGESETFIRSKVSGLVEHGADVRVLETGAGVRRSVSPDGVAIQRAVLAAGGLYRPLSVAQLVLRSRSLPGLRWSLGKDGWRAELQRWELATLEPDLTIFAFSGIAASAYVGAIAAGLPGRVVVSCRGAAENIVPIIDDSRPKKLATVFDNVDLVHCVSDDMADVVRSMGCHHEKIWVNRPAVNTKSFTTGTGTVPPSRVAEVLTVLRLHWAKGYEFALLAMASLRDRGVAFRYRIVGGGPEREKLEFLIAQLGLGDCVELLGWRSPEEVAELMKSSDLYLLPSLSEGLNNGVLEAMASGLPVVSTDVNGMPEAVSDGMTGSLVPPGSADAIADALYALATDEELRRRYGLLGRRRATAEFDIGDQAERFALRYSDLLRS